MKVACLGRSTNKSTRPGGGRAPLDRCAVLSSRDRVGRFANQQRRRHHGQAGLLAAALCSAPAARGADEPVILSWSVPSEADCPDATYALHEIRRHLGPAPAERPPIRASVVIRGARGRYQMVLKTEQRDTEGERVLSDASCGAVADAAIVVLAWMIDPNAGFDPSRNPAAVATAPAAEPAPRDATVEPAPRRAGTFVVGLGPSGEVGTLPSVTMGAEARGEALVRPFRVEAHGSFWPSRSTTIGVLPDGRGAGGTFTLW